MTIKKETIILLVKFIPYPTFDGGAFRNRAWIEFLSKYFHVIVIGYWNKKYGDIYINSINSKQVSLKGEYYKTNLIDKIFRFLFCIFYNQSYLLKKYISKKLQIQINKVISETKPRFILCSELALMQYRDNIPHDVPVFYDAHNLEYKFLERMSNYINSLKKIIIRHESKLVKRFEFRSAKNADKIFFTTSSDRNELVKAANIPSIKTKVVPNSFPDKGGLDINKLSSQASLVFTGNLSWPPNTQGILHFLKNILPRLQSSIPDVCVNLVGSNVSRRILNFESKLPVKVYGELSEEDKDNIIKKSWIGIAPVYFGSGSRIKIIEYWSYGKTVVSTELGSEGLRLPNGTKIVNTDEEFTLKLKDILLNKDKIISFGQENYIFYKRYYSTEKIYEDSLHHTLAT